MLGSCSFFKKKSAPDKDIIARVNEEYLYKADVEPFTKGLKGQDSLNAIKAYTESWIRKKLLLRKAIDNISDEDVTIARKLEDYKESLLLYEYEKALIGRKLDTVISNLELTNWYSQVKADFPLQQDVYRLQYIRLKKDAPDIEQVTKWILKPKGDENALQLEGYCKEYAVAYTTGEGRWYTKESIITGFPLSESDIASLSGSKQYRQFKTDEELWFVRLSEHLQKDEPSPIEIVASDISRAIIEKRRVKLVEGVYEKIYQDGLKSNSFEVYTK